MACSKIVCTSKNQCHAFIVKSVWHLCMDMQFRSCWIFLLLCARPGTLRKVYTSSRIALPKWYHFASGNGYCIFCLVLLSPPFHCVCVSFSPKFGEQTNDRNYLCNTVFKRKTSCQLYIYFDYHTNTCSNSQIVAARNMECHTDDDGWKECKRERERIRWLFSLFIQSTERKLKMCKTECQQQRMENETQICLFSV